MSAPVNLIGLVRCAIAVCLIATFVALIYGHVGGESVGLNTTQCYVSEYMKRAPHWPWLIVGAFAFALLLSFLAFAFLLCAGRSPWIVLGCLLLTGTSMATFFVAYGPVRRVAQPPPPAHQWWTPTWWFISKTSSTPYEHGMADAYSDVHYRATRLAVVTSVIAMAVLALGLLRWPETQSFGRLTIAAAIVMSIFFLMGDNLAAFRGLWQRVGFMTMYFWLWSAWHLCGKLPQPGENASVLAGQTS